ncbi:MAG: hypothetical protein ACFFDR_05470 [Candidatus Thorarchaeota archaeon]
MMMERKVIAIAVVLVAVVGVSGYALLLGSIGTTQVPPPNEPPGDETIIITAGDVVLWAEAEYWQDFMPSDDPSHPFFAVIRVNITNNGNTTIENLGALRTTIYYNDTLTPFVTLNLTQAIQTLVPITVSPGESVVIEYINDRSTVFSPTIDEGTGLYSQVLFRWGSGQEAILTTTPTELYFTF